MKANIDLLREYEEQHGHDEQAERVRKASDQEDVKFESCGSLWCLSRTVKSWRSESEKRNDQNV